MTSEELDEVVKVILNPPTQPVATSQSEAADILGAGDVQDPHVGFKVLQAMNCPLSKKLFFL